MENRYLSVLRIEGKLGRGVGGRGGGGDTDLFLNCTTCTRMTKR